ncbi:MAG: AAA family ATPase, partial [Clostridia bacterium]|nr:AAA family ATPase [Clostridia bacterium]
MKLEFAYFDFTDAGKSQNGYRNMGECALNFSTTHDYSVERSGENRSYKITRSEKPLDKKLPKGFWGENIYNITALVGDNGSGKSTILHNLIRCLLQARDGGEAELRPSVPFCIIFLNRNGEPNSYCDKNSHFYGLDFVGNVEYPGSFKKLKCMLFDNTLTLSSSDFYNLLEECCHRINNYNNQNLDAFEHKKQLFNKSLAASILSNCYFSRKKFPENTPGSLLIEHYLDMHMKYESYQEIRFILNRRNYEMLEKLRNDGYPVPVPDEVEIHIDRLVLEDALITRGYATSTLVSEFPISHPFGLLIRQILINMFYDGVKPQKGNHYGLIELIRNNKFLVVKDSNKVSISLKDVFEDETRYEFFSEFLNRYRSIVRNDYFLTFSFGLSSGEKNILKMLTQFAYIIEGERYPGDKESGRNRIVNQFSVNDQDETECDTLLLFFDEADLTYHPEWQRRFVGILTEVLPKMFGKYVKDIQVILATHSPLMLSDFPDASTIYLKHGRDGLVCCDNSGNMSTFAQNIYYILRDGFFLNDTIGDFAMKKLNEVAEWCRQVVEKDNEPEASYSEIKKNHDDTEKEFQKAKKIFDKKKKSFDEITDSSDSKSKESIEKAEKEYQNAQKKLNKAIAMHKHASEELKNETIEYASYLIAVRKNLKKCGEDSGDRDVMAKLKELYSSSGKDIGYGFDKWLASQKGSSKWL